MSNIVERLTENIVARDLRKEGAALVSKWEKTGLLEGLGDDRKKDNMSRLLENQAKELLREASTMAAGDVEGFAAVAFPIVRRVFGGLLANDLVSVQPMSLPSGLIFFLDFTKTNVRLGQPADVSVYGGAKVGAQITGGVDLTKGAAGSVGGIESGLYNLNNGYSSPVKGQATAAATLHIATSGAINANGEFQAMTQLSHTALINETQAREILRYDADITSGTGVVIIKTLASNFDQLNRDNLQSIAYMEGDGVVLSGSLDQGGLKQARRLTGYLAEDTNRDYVYSVFTTTGSVNVGTVDQAQMKNLFVNGQITKSLGYVQFNSADDFTNAAVGGVKGTADWLLESTSTTVSGEFGDDLEAIPEIDIKVDSVAVTAVTKKLRAKWSPELGQDLNAYHNLDAEVELTGILSEQVALEIDREILEDLIKRATAGRLHWSRNPGQFLNRETGSEVGAASAAPDFTGTVSEWYETLIETINDVSARIHRKTLRGGANFVVCSPEVAGILEFTAGFRAAVTVDSNGTAGAVNVGSISKKFDVHVDPYFPRNIVLVGRKGNSFLESGYVYAPYVPLQVTPTIFGTEDFAPRKGVLTRYGKKMVRPDMYGLVICHGLNGSNGAS
tara:strand:+ start:10688 stop:12538 length:1851 start_codon:yes stop_codon:yes gene_type:complete